METSVTEQRNRKNTTHSYNSTAVYNIKLTVSDGSLTDNDTTTANITEETLITDTDGDDGVTK